ncbi:hypothetical protein SAMN05443544_3960 [Agromyces cerinus subsp. cerinus]|uniref:Uncharacterized protein n=1 Tax=Agromyces cerinus subsp. cerinus TaxID=232089 RepID=A0A1N6IEW6_9MICO|nr:hypothetical protein SAMN05443544_3960 [Agromyces cerinus subsp. cerinus]
MLAVIVLLVLASCGIIAAIGGSSGNDDYKGCSKSLPTDDFQDCINREGVWSGID